MPQTRRDFLGQLTFGLAGVHLLAGLPEALAGKPIKSLPRSSPEEQGVSSAGIVNFVQVAERRRFKLHSLMVLRNGHVVAEGWWNPYRADLKHTLYSLSKSITATAVGLAVAENRLTVEDQVVSFFPEDLPEDPDQWLASMRVKDLLKMATGHTLTDAEIFAKVLGGVNDNWVRTFFSLPITHEPGTRFQYNTMATYMLGRIVQKLSGQTLMDYLKPRLFDPLGIEGADWEIDTQRNNVGGWGLRMRTEDIAKFGQLYLNYGVWNEQQVVSSAWIDAATQVQIVQPKLEKPKRAVEQDDWQQGYGYQLWGCRNGAYRADGACGQFCLVLPEQNAVIVMTAEQGDMQAVLDEVWNHLLPALQRTNQTTDATQKSFQRSLEELAILPPVGGINLPSSIPFNGKRYRIEDNPQGISQFSLSVAKTGWTMELEDKKGKHAFRGGVYEWREGLTDLSYLPLKLLPTPVPNETETRYAASGVWKNANTFQITIRFIETAHYDTLTCQFADNKVQIISRGSLADALGRKETRPDLTGTLV